MSTGSKQAKKRVQAAVVLALAVYAANALAVKWGWSPFLYCWGRETAWATADPFLSLVRIGLLIWMAVRIAKGDVWGSLAVGVLAVFAFGLPQFATTIFSLGASCE